MLRLIEINNLLLHTFAYMRDTKVYHESKYTWTADCLTDAMKRAEEWATDNKVFDDVFLYYLDNNQDRIIFRCIIDKDFTGPSGRD